MIRSTITLLLLGAMLASSQSRKGAQNQKTSEDHKVLYTTEEQPLVAEVRAFHDAPYEIRSSVAKPLALKIRRLPASPNKLRLADALAIASAAGDTDHDGLQ